MKKRFWMAAAACFVLAAVCILLPSPWGWLRTTLTILSVPLLVGGMLLVVNALLPAHVLPVLGLDEPEHAPVPVPPPPSLPQNLPVEQRVLGSLRGAVRAMEGMNGTFDQPPMLAWQFERLKSSCAGLLAALEAEGADPAQAADFAVQYLPNVMQYLLACSHEGCPAEAAYTLARAACACERQLDALAAGEYVTFEQEYYAVRGDLQAAGFRWDW